MIDTYIALLLQQDEWDVFFDFPIFWKSGESRILELKNHLENPDLEKKEILRRTDHNDTLYDYDYTPHLLCLRNDYTVALWFGDYDDLPEKMEDFAEEIDDLYLIRTLDHKKDIDSTWCHVCIIDRMKYFIQILKWSRKDNSFIRMSWADHMEDDICQSINVDMRIEAFCNTLV